MGSINKFLSYLIIGLINAYVLNCNAAPKPIITDSRIKTFVFSNNEVYRIVIYYGYQTMIEFSKGETVEVISTGESHAWQMSPLNNSLFIKPLEGGGLTNATVITNKRIYQFEIESKTSIYSGDDELVYVVRFFYPDEQDDQILPEVESSPQEEGVPIPNTFNYNYTLSGDKSLAPIEIFDDGINTFFKFAQGNLPTDLFIKSDKGKAWQDQVIRHRGKYVYVNTIASKFMISSKKNNVVVYNENHRQDRK